MSYTKVVIERANTVYELEEKMNMSLYAETREALDRIPHANVEVYVERVIHTPEGFVMSAQLDIQASE